MGYPNPSIHCSPVLPSSPPQCPCQTLLPSAPVSNPHPHCPSPSCAIRCRGHPHPSIHCSPPIQGPLPAAERSRETHTTHHLSAFLVLQAPWYTPCAPLVHPVRTTGVTSGMLPLCHCSCGDTALTSLQRSHSSSPLSCFHSPNPLVHPVRTPGITPGMLPPLSLLFWRPKIGQARALHPQCHSVTVSLWCFDRGVEA